MNLNKILGCLVGGGIGDALGAPIEFMSLDEIHTAFGPDGLVEYSPAFGKLGVITDDTQMTLFTLEGMIRTKMRWLDRGITSVQDVVHNAYLRWLLTQREQIRIEIPTYVSSGWLFEQQVLHNRRAPGNTCISALLDPTNQGSIEDPINDSKGCGGVMRAAPAGFFLEENNFQIGCQIAAITHGHPSGYLSAGFLSEMISKLLQNEPIYDSIHAVRYKLEQYPNHEEVLNAVIQALNLADYQEASAEHVEKLGAGWVAEEALAISIYCSLMAENFLDGVLLAVNHSGDSDSTGAITGNILGALYGTDGIPVELIKKLEVRPLMEEMVKDGIRIFQEETGVEREFMNKYPPN